MMFIYSTIMRQVGSDGADDFEECEIQEEDETEIEYNMSTEEGEQPIHQVQYTIKTIDKLVEVQAGMMMHIANLLNTNLDNALLLLYHFRWDSEKLIDAYLDSPEEILQKVIGKANTYYHRYKNHEQSAKLEKAVYAKAEQNMTKLQLEINLSWNEAQFLKHAVETIVKCRNTLKWTYAFAYYLKESNEKTLFEDNQENFEVATEQLSELLELPIEKENSAALRKMIIDKTVYVSQRQSVLLDHATQGLQDGIWLFDFDVYC
ncbi:E3 ubiquitin-protein ligase dbl4 [Choanephora cucurbitarum]|uniref:E3 ubiquitin-protein ligase dbl4 n=1 Tax=Choanephora cucurbitarum TaxID=101091 RepID=A0A1C7NDX7_9FUNG|nr:E3 ubiquitin-protein ligase dbl4 [Choanephora cucurbitarum]